MAVYAILFQSNHDYSTVAAYGDVKVLFPLGVNMTKVDVICDAADKWFEDFDFDEDYFLAVGNPIVVSIVSMRFAEAMAAADAVSAKFLEWEKQNQSYTIRHYDLEG